MGYVFGVLLFFGIIIYWMIAFALRGANEIVYLAKSRTYKNFTFDRINTSEEYPVIRYVKTKEGLETTLREIAQELDHYAYFRYENLITYEPTTLEFMATDYLMSKKGLVSRHMAEYGCYREPERAPQIVFDAMDAYMQLIQENILNATGTSIWRKEICWKNHRKNYVWCDSPADPEWWKQGKDITSGYKCTYRTKPMGR